MADEVENPESEIEYSDNLGVVFSIPGVGEHGMQLKWIGERGRS